MAHVGVSPGSGSAGAVLFSGRRRYDTTGQIALHGSFDLGEAPGCGQQAFRLQGTAKNLVISGKDALEIVQGFIFIFVHERCPGQVEVNGRLLATGTQGSQKFLPGSLRVAPGQGNAP